MKISNILKSIALGAVVLTSCETYYDDHNFPGYEEGSVIVDKKKIEYTLTDADYATIASNSTNKALAEEKGLSAELAALKTTLTFTDLITAKDFMPAFLKASYPTADDGSVANITYNNAAGFPDDITKVAAAASYTLSSDNYKAAWGSEDDYVDNLTPNTISKLAKNIDTAELNEGQLVVATYNYSEQEPVFSSGGDEPTIEFSSVLGVAPLNEAVSVVGQIVAESAQGPIVADKTGAVLLYKTTGVALGDIVEVEGTISAYNFGFQISGGTVNVVKNDSNVARPAAVTIDGAALDQLLLRDKNEYAKFAKFNGEITVSGNYLNFTVEGATAATGSVYGATDALKTAVGAGYTGEFYGYISSISKSGGVAKFVNVIICQLGNEKPVNGYSSALATAAVGSAIDMTGVVMAVSTQGPILADNSGAVLLYKGSGYAVGDVVNVAGTLSQYNNGYQIDATSATCEILANGAYANYPYPLVLDGAGLDACLEIAAPQAAKYVEVECTISVSGNYYNFSVEGATAATGSFYGITDTFKSSVADGDKVLLRGYWMSVSKSGGVPKFVNIVASEVIPANAPSVKAPMGATVTPKSSKKYAIFSFDGTRLTETDYAVLQPSDYEKMGLNAGYLGKPDAYLLKYMNLNFPYAQKGDSKIVAYLASATQWAAQHYTFDGEAWVKDNGYAPKTDQFRVTDNQWAIDLTLELDYSVMGSAEFKAFLQYCCNWVYDNIDVKEYGATPRDNAGDILSTDAVKVNGASPADAVFVSTYGNNEWYAGTYAYYGEMNWSGPKAAAAWAAAGYTLTEDEIVEKMKQNAAIVFQNVLHYMYPDYGPETFRNVVIKVYDYVSSSVYSYKFAVVGVGEYEYIEDSFVQL